MIASPKLNANQMNHAPLIRQFSVSQPYLKFRTVNLYVYRNGLDDRHVRLAIGRLVNADIATLGQLMAMAPHSLGAIRSFGQATQECLLELLRRMHHNPELLLTFDPEADYGAENRWLKRTIHKNNQSYERFDTIADINKAVEFNRANDTEYAKKIKETMRERGYII